MERNFIPGMVPRTETPHRLLLHCEYPSHSQVRGWWGLGSGTSGQPRSHVKAPLFQP